MSLIQRAKALGISYSASAKTISNYDPNVVFNDAFFATLEEPQDQWWQISFSKKVKISSYILSASTLWLYRAKTWEVGISNNNKTFKRVILQSGEIYNNKSPYVFDTPVECKHFRITLKENCNKENSYLLFSYFDCTIDECKTQTKNYKYKMFTHINHVSFCVLILNCS